MSSAVVKRRAIAMRTLLTEDKADISAWTEGHDEYYDTSSDSRAVCTSNARTQVVYVSTPEGVVLEVDFSSMHDLGMLRNVRSYKHVRSYTHGEEDEQYTPSRVCIKNPSRRVLLALQRRLLSNRTILV